MRGVRRLIIGLGIGLALFASPALAQSLEGDWELKTSDFDTGCEIVGDITFTKTAMPGGYTCNFVSEQICTAPGEAEPYLYIQVEQSCVAQRIGSAMNIKSEVSQVLKRTPAYPPGVNPNDYYLPDNFVLQVSKGGLEMVGSHYDEIRRLKARFWRKVDLTS